MSDVFHVAPPTEADPALITLVELIFFAYRDFTGEADVILAEFGLGRAHHRVLHFVHRHPGLRVTDLLTILNITKQSLGRVLTPLVDDGFVESREGHGDRRTRELQLTPKGTALISRLIERQTARIASAIGSAGPAANRQSREDEVRRFLFAMIAPEERDDVTRLLSGRI